MWSRISSCTFLGNDRTWFACTRKTSVECIGRSHGQRRLHAERLESGCVSWNQSFFAFPEMIKGCKAWQAYIFPRSDPTKMRKWPGITFLPTTTSSRPIFTFQRTRVQMWHVFKRTESVARVPMLLSDQKPISFVSHFVSKYRQPGAIILDPCQGTGATLNDSLLFPK